MMQCKDTSVQNMHYWKKVTGLPWWKVLFGRQKYRCSRCKAERVGWSKDEGSWA